MAGVGGGFSGALKITDLNDFIAPSQSCVVNLDGTKLGAQDDDDLHVGEVAIQPRGQAASQPSASGGFQQTTGGKDGKALKVTLHDCLACSGCVTSAETVLLQAQSTSEFLTKTLDTSLTVIVSVSPQSRASLGVVYGLSPEQAFRKISHFLRGMMRAKFVFDTSASRDIALLETANEFIERMRAKQQGASNSAHADAMDVDSAENAAGTSGAGPIPMLASACPGWVCYAEKTHGTWVLPYISKARSPQAVMGSIVKRVFAEARGLKPDKVYHVAVMPCYDKKLEASRDDFWIPGTEIPEVDCVLTTSELHELMAGLNLADMPDKQVDPLYNNVAPDTGVLLTAGGSHGGSGGYLEYLFRRAARELHGIVVPEGPLPMQTLRNTDMKEVALEADGKTVMKFASAYGFRNIQTLLRKMKRGKCEYDYVEVMACPGGCLNGAGQVKANVEGASMEDSATQLLAALDQHYHAASIQHQAPEDSAMVKEIYANAPRDLFRTDYHHREKTVTSAIADW